ncbi:nuclear pore complex protein Nup50 isoform X1 [Cricetulus griseus]|uniref:Nuclear pore complex protein Nup50 n=2 Tax=Cricetulus griseus TaxID=10029 RepID=A0A3L7IAH2_CRIGR|nr:nuclear pore complex protein Nup50 isoform X1 [Cricetulus griseus]XP_027251967.1 nuclear pore complex protein Nup50 isoform X2 [Cricetulus griseus]
MAKRIAEKELTDRNWDQEDEAEEVGTFSVASEEVLKNRAIKKAKRRNVGFESDSGGAFKGFKGLVAPSGGGGFSGFGGGSGGKPLEGLTNGNSAASTTSFSSTKLTAVEPKATFGSFAVNGPTTLVDKKISSPKCNSSNQLSSSGPVSSTVCSGSAYHKQLAGLNCSVRDWIVKHVNTNPLCDLTPIFKDYERYLATIEKQLENGGSSSSESQTDRASIGMQPPSLFSSTKLQQESPFSFHGNKAEDTSEKEFTAEKKSDTTQGATSASFNFGKKIESSVLGSLSSGSLTGFSFSPGNSSLFGKDAAQSKAASSLFSAKAPESQAGGSSSECRGGGDEEEENDEPPKVVVTEVKEEDAFYSKKCKLFYKKDNEFKEKGVGTLHLKPTANQKTQLLVRADTNLGNILLNVLIPPNMPCTRTGKNNVLIVCVPNPPLDEKQPTVPATMLIRVKTGEDADELHKILLQKKDA